MVGRPLISVLMPTHKRVDVIGIAIQSVLKQTVADFELLVVGDGCAAGTGDVVAGFNDDRIRFFDLPKAPYFGYANRNIALREARGRLIGFAADDDILLRDHFDLLTKCLEGRAAIAHSQALWISTDGIAAPFMTNLEMPDELSNFMGIRNSIPASCFLYRADSLPSLDSWPEDLTHAADWRLWQRIIRENSQPAVVHCRQPTLLHFSAKWKRSRSSAMPQFATLLDIADAGDWWPTDLRVQVAPEQSEQQAFWELLDADPTTWTATIRQAARDVTAHLAWDDVQIVRPALKAASDELIAVQEDLASARVEIAAAKTRTQFAEESLGTARNEVETCQAEKQALSARLTASITEVERLGADVERLSGEIRCIHSSLAWRIQQAIGRTRWGRNLKH